MSSFEFSKLVDAFFNNLIFLFTLRLISPTFLQPYLDYIKNAFGIYYLLQSFVLYSAFFYFYIRSRYETDIDIKKRYYANSIIISLYLFTAVGIFFEIPFICILCRSQNLTIYEKILVSFGSCSFALICICMILAFYYPPDGLGTENIFDRLKKNDSKNKNNN